jgi:hypothetical protein
MLRLAAVCRLKSREWNLLSPADLRQLVRGRRRRQLSKLLMLSLEE